MSNKPLKRNESLGTGRSTGVVTPVTGYLALILDTSTDRNRSKTGKVMVLEVEQVEIEAREIKSCETGSSN